MEVLLILATDRLAAVAVVAMVRVQLLAPVAVAAMVQAVMAERRELAVVALMALTLVVLAVHSHQFQFGAIPDLRAALTAFPFKAAAVAVCLRPAQTELAAPRPAVPGG